jgi:hypothetical protein
MEPVADKNTLWLKNTPPDAMVSLGNGWQDRVRTKPVEIKAGSPVFPFDGRDQRAAEQYRIIRTKILQHPNPLYIIAISSPQLGDGKSVTAVNVAGALALKNEISVLLVDSDFRRSALATLFDVPTSPGLTEVLSGESSIEPMDLGLRRDPEGLRLLHHRHAPGGRGGGLRFGPARGGWCRVGGAAGLHQPETLPHGVAEHPQREADRGHYELRSGLVSGPTAQPRLLLLPGDE